MELSVSAEEEAAGSSEQRAGSSRIGRLPILWYMSSGAQHLQQPLQRCPSALQPGMRKGQ